MPEPLHRALVVRDTGFNALKRKKKVVLFVYKCRVYVNRV